MTSYLIIQLLSFAVFLLEGVTGSGKTEVYLQTMREVIERGQQVLLLVPEIGLTPQLVARVAQRFACRVAVLHSGLSDGERYRAWCEARSSSSRTSRRRHAAEMLSTAWGGAVA